jgi:ATP-dependent DNA helicase RecG
VTPAPPSGPAPDGGPGRKLRQLAELPVSVLKGVGAVAERELAELGIESVLDLITHYPRRYIDGTRLIPIADLAVGDRASILAEVTRVSRPTAGYGRGRRRGPSRVTVEIADESGRLAVVFFNQAWRANQLAPGTLALFYGTIGTYRDALQLNSPTAEVLRAAGDDADDDDDAARSGRVFPVYPLTEKAKLTSGRLTRYVGEALDRAGRFADPLPEVWRSRFGLVDRTTAFNDIHRPAAMSDREPARRRLAFDELLRLQLALVLRQRRLQADARGLRHLVSHEDGAPTLMDRFLDDLPFEPTAAQQRAIAALRDDLAGPLPMHRLLQGDVGAGKTVVAVAALLVGVEGGH